MQRVLNLGQCKAMSLILLVFLFGCGNSKEAAQPVARVSERQKASAEQDQCSKKTQLIQAPAKDTGTTQCPDFKESLDIENLQKTTTIVAEDEVTQGHQELDQPGLGGLEPTGAEKQLQEELEAEKEKPQEESLKIVTYNTGLLKKLGQNFVPCVDERIEPQLQALFAEDVGVVQGKDPFVLVLQEVWAKEAFYRYLTEATDRDYFVYPKSYSEIKTNGQMIISNLVEGEQEPQMHFFAEDGPADTQRGLRVSHLKWQGSDIEIINIHTSYSTAKKFKQRHSDQFQELIEYVASGDKESLRIVAGDFNAGHNLELSQQSYDPIDVIWSPIVDSLGLLGMKWAETAPDELTWDTFNNPLVSQPAWPIKVIGGWEEHNSTLDHIFFSDSFQIVGEADIVLDQPVELAKNCRGKSGSARLSDHYGVAVTLKFPAQVPFGSTVAN